MTPVKWIALQLLVGRVITLSFIVVVIWWQLGLLHKRDEPELRTGRRVALALAVVMAVGQLIPIAIDVAALFDLSSAFFVIVYAYSNNISAMVGVILLWYLYLLARRSNKTPLQR